MHRTLPKDEVHIGHELAAAELRFEREQRRLRFVQRATRRHGARFSYRDVVLRSSDDHHVRIACEHHGAFFEVTPRQHLNSIHGGCPDCLQEARRAPKTRDADTTLSIHREVANPETNEVATVEEWARRCGITTKAMNKRLERWPAARALTAGKHQVYGGHDDE